MESIKIEGVDIIFNDLGKGEGKIIIAGYNHNYSYTWGAMGDDLKTFLCRINSSYFADKLLGTRSCYKFDSKKTFANLRKHIREEMGLPFYKHVEFQKEMREILNDFQNECEERGESYFVESFHYSFINKLPFYNIEARSYEQKRVENDFKEICEVWHFIGTRLSYEYQFLCKLHSKIKRAIKSKKTN